MVEEDVVLGCHQGALFGTSLPASDLLAQAESRGGHLTCQLASNLSFHCIHDWFFAHEVTFSFNRGIVAPTAEYCLDACRAALAANWPTRRQLFDATGQRRTIVRKGTNTGCTRLNRHHDALE